MQHRLIRSAIERLDTDDVVVFARFGVLNYHVEVAVVIEGARIE
jgi:hypothetical protein